MNIPLVRILPIVSTVAFSPHIYSAEVSAPTELILGHPPVADRVTIIMGGNSVTKALPGQDVSASFEFSDADGDLEVGSTFTWQYNSGTDYLPLKDDRGNDITSQNLALSDAMAGMQLRVCVTPRSSPVTSLPAHGEERCSSALQVSYPEPAVRSLEFDANNEYYEGKKISLRYEINTHGFPNKSKYDVFTDVTPSQLETQVDNNPAMVTKSLVSNQGVITYTIQNDDVGKLLSFAVLPNNGVIGPSRAIGTNSKVAPPFYDTNFTVATGAVANGVSTNAVSATVTNARGLPVADVKVTFVVTGAARFGNMTGRQSVVATTNASGVASTVLVSQVAADNSVTAQVGSHTTGAKRSAFVVDIATAGIRSEPEAVRNAGVANGNYEFGLSYNFYVTDARGNPVPGAVIQFKASSSTLRVSVNNSQAITDRNGMANVKVTAPINVGGCWRQHQVQTTGSYKGNNKTAVGILMSTGPGPC